MPSPSPADLHLGPDPAHVQAMADELHRMLCTALFPATTSPLFSEQHHDGDRSKARFVLAGLRDSGYVLTGRDA